MVSFRRLFSSDERDTARNLRGDLRSSLIPHPGNGVHSVIPAKRVTAVALRLKHLIEQAVPCELKESQITRPHSRIITRTVVQLAKDAGSEDGDQDCVVYCLLVCLRWFKRQAILEMYDADLNYLRAEAAQVIAKQIIESLDDDQDYLFQNVLMRRYSILRNGEESTPANAVERAVDLHAVRVIASSGFQKCINYIWRGWLVQDLDRPTEFMAYKHVANKSWRMHFDHDRIRAPKYQNAFQVLISVVYLALYTAAINTINPEGDIDVEEALLYFFTASFLADECTKLWKVGRFYLSFWNTFNLTLYSLLTVSFAIRMVALAHPLGSAKREGFDHLSYNFLAFCAPMFWCRMLLYLDAIRFFGAMLVVLKMMMMESVIFFALLMVVIIGFLQAFIGLDGVDSNYADDTVFILESMTKAILQSPEFEGFESFGHPFGLILYYLFTFVVMVVLLNILIALYNQAYTDITENAIDEYLALFAHKTLQFVRAPDENVFLPPFNLIEIFGLIVPFEWWLPRARYARLNDYVMAALYSPFMALIACYEVAEARKVVAARARGEQDDAETEEWEELGVGPDVLSEDWRQRVVDSVPDVEEERAVIEVKKLREEVRELRKAVGALPLPQQQKEEEEEENEAEANGDE